MVVCGVVEMSDSDMVGVVWVAGMVAEVAAGDMHGGGSRHGRQGRVVPCSVRGRTRVC